MTSLRGALRKLSIKPGDVILVKDWTLTERVANIGIERLAGTPILEVRDFKDVRTISEESMARLGWYRKDTP